jgi:hypothetical protein
VSDDFSGQGNVEYLKSGRGFGSVQDAEIADIKAHWLAQGIACRPPLAQAQNV